MVPLCKISTTSSSDNFLFGHGSALLDVSVPEYNKLEMRYTVCTVYYMHLHLDSP